MMMLKRSAIILSLSLAACAHAPPAAIAKTEPVSDVQVAQVTVDEAEQVVVPEPKAEKSLNLPKVELTGPLLYQFLLGDVAEQRGQKELAAQIYLELAATTQDPRVARRAAQLAFEARQLDKAVEAFNLWVKLEPDSTQAKQLLLTLLITGGRLEEARPHLAAMLAADPDQAGRTFVQIYPLLAHYPDKDAALKLLRDLAQPYPTVVETHLILAQAAGEAGKGKLALEEVRKARALQPEGEMAVLLEAQLLQKESPQQALDMLKKYVAAHPASGEARLVYARMLLAQNKLAESRTEFKRLLDEHQDNADMAFAVAMLSLELGDLDRAEEALRQALANGKKDASTVYYHLGQVSEARKHDDEALENYHKVKDGEHAYDARLRVVYLLYKGGKLEEARDYLHQTVATNNPQRVQLILVDAQLLRDAKQTEAAYKVLTQGLEILPNHPDLLYEAGMVAEQLAKFDEFEKMMRKVIELKPDHAQAYNALGYSFLDRNVHLEEGMQLVQKASQLAPDDAGIIDSVGWGHYRLGNLSKSLEFLRRAYKSSADPDPEIVAHFGEVLWVQGDKAQAKKLWSEALKLHPDSVPLQAVMKKFLP